MTPELKFKVGDRVRILPGAFDDDVQFKPLCGHLATVVAAAAYWHPSSPPYKIGAADAGDDWALQCGFPPGESIDADGGFVWVYGNELEAVAP